MVTIKENVMGTYFVTSNLYAFFENGKREIIPNSEDIKMTLSFVAYTDQTELILG